jgi:hypothetical protein
MRLYVEQQMAERHAAFMQAQEMRQQAMRMHMAQAEAVYVLLRRLSRCGRLPTARCTGKRPPRSPRDSRPPVPPLSVQH